MEAPSAEMVAGSPAAGLPFDARQMQAASDLIGAGGPVLLLLILLSVIATAFALAKIWQFRHLGRAGAMRTLRILEDRSIGQADRARQLDRLSNPVARLIADLLQHPVALPEPAIWQAAQEVIEPYRSHMRLLEVIAMLAPLLGLLGTVLGMIEAFQVLSVAKGQSDPQLLSSGIWEALLTTAAGLMLAIPVTALVNWLDRRLERLSFDMEAAIVRLMMPDQSALRWIDTKQQDSASDHHRFTPAQAAE